MALDQLALIDPSSSDFKKPNEGRPLGDILARFSTKGSKNEASKSGMKEEPDIKADLAVYSAKIVQCGHCERKYYENFDRDMLFYVYDCWHVFCMPCINKYVNSEFINNGGNLKCLKPGCDQYMMEDQVKGLLGPEKFEVLQNKAIRKMCNLIECCKCKA